MTRLRPSHSEQTLSLSLSDLTLCAFLAVVLTINNSTTNCGIAHPPPPILVYIAPRTPRSATTIHVLCESFIRLGDHSVSGLDFRAPLNVATWQTKLWITKADGSSFSGRLEQQAAVYQRIYGRHAAMCIKLITIFEVNVMWMSVASAFTRWKQNVLSCEKVCCYLTWKRFQYLSFTNKHKC